MGKVNKNRLYNIISVYYYYFHLCAVICHGRSKKKLHLEDFSVFVVLILRKFKKKEEKESSLLCCLPAQKA